MKSAGTETSRSEVMIRLVLVSPIRLYVEKGIPNYEISINNYFSPMLQGDVKINNELNEYTPAMDKTSTVLPQLRATSPISQIHRLHSDSLDL